MTNERLFLLCGVNGEGTITASWAALCERCTVHDGPATLRTYLAMLPLAAQLRELGVEDGACTVVCHHNGVEVRHGEGADMRRIAFLKWRTPVSFRTASEPRVCWH